MTLLKFVVGIVCCIVGSRMFIKAIKQRQKIDTESIAIVKEVISLGREDGKKVYAIKYNVHSSQPFDILESPCKKPAKVGSERAVFYENNEPTKNYYFKTIGQFDSRLMPPIAITFVGFVLASFSIVVWLG